MKGIIRYIKNDICAIELENTFFVIYEDFLGMSDVDDVVSGNLESLGETNIRNESKNMDLIGFLDDIYLNEDEAKEKLENK